MKISYNWIKKYVDISIEPEEAAEKLTMSGSEVGSFEKTPDGDVIMELEITANRPDCLNMTGIAREISAVCDIDLKLPDFSVKEGAPSGPSIDCVVEDPGLCPRYTARVITGVSVKPLADELKKYILAVGMREINNIVDITNYCLMETGQPMHAFDLDKIKGAKIIVRKAKKGEKITTIDGVERALEEGMLVIADGSGPVAVAGVMGGKNTEVTEKTKNILLESAYFDPLSVRRTARKLGLSSDSSYRFERGVDKDMVKKASDRASALIVKYAGGKVGGFYKAGECSHKETVIDLDIGKAGGILGITLDKASSVKILKRLGMDVIREEGDIVKVKVPGSRQDVTKEIDLVEEVARVYGYDKIPERVEKIIPQAKRKDKERVVRERICGILAGCGLNEIMTYSLVNEKAASSFPDFRVNPVSLWNPLSEEHKILTPQLLSGMLKAISWNLNRKNSDLFFFETGKVYQETGEEAPYREIPVLCLGATGDAMKNWVDGERGAGFFDLKGVIENLLERLGFLPVFTPARINGFLNPAEISLGENGEKAGFIGQTDLSVNKEYDIDQNVYLAQIDLSRIFEKAVLDRKYEPVPKFPFAKRDISVICGKDLSAGEIKKIILSGGEGIVRSVDIVSQYEGSPVPSGKRSVTFSVAYGDLTRTLKDDEVVRAHSKIRSLISDKFGVEFR